ncbi:transposase [[Mycoplasma] gypis]|uniref:Mutator family transposase n=1 Tax=[Mycoplasma] gypis TaxID=92404 RepID=A0ABZ2RQE4_9BACT|nr:transposase [[Mycoplasma] gypis]MBN0919278.1 transposase [[Mycoplasma] gypis]
MKIIKKDFRSHLNSVLNRKHLINDCLEFDEAFTALFKNTIEKLIEMEFDHFMEFERSDIGVKNSNFKNGHSTKIIKTKYGSFPINIRRDRKNEFETKLFDKNSHDFNYKEDLIIALNASNNDYTSIEQSVAEMFDNEIPEELLKNIAKSFYENQKFNLSHKFSFRMISVKEIKIEKHNEAYWIVFGRTRDENVILTILKANLENNEKNMELLFENLNENKIKKITYFAVEEEQCCRKLIEEKSKEYNFKIIEITNSHEE